MQSALFSGRPTLNNEGNGHKHDKITIDDWSGTGRGSHVEFKYGEAVPLEQGNFLGRGAMGDVFETTVSGYKLAHKRIVIRRKIGDIEKKEIEILKKVSSNTHMIQLIGTYTHRQFLGLLLHPVAVCDLHTFFGDVEDWHLLRDSEVGLDQTQQERLTALGFDFPEKTRGFDRASFVYHKIGCLVSAVEYLHDQKIRHKDLKPSNILLSQDCLWLSDFGSATDFSLLSQSATDNERGTPRYFSPEAAAWKPSGRSSDMFSLGCILLEILVLHDRGTLAHIRQNRSSDPSFHANLDKVEVWCTPSIRRVPMLWSHISQEIKLLLTEDPAIRSTARQTLIKLTAYDISYSGDTQASVFGDCCRGVFVNAREREISSQKKDFKFSKHQRERNNALATIIAQKSKSDKIIPVQVKQWLQNQHGSNKIIAADRVIKKHNNLPLNVRTLPSDEYDSLGEGGRNGLQRIERQTRNRDGRLDHTMVVLNRDALALEEELSEQKSKFDHFTFPATESE